MAAATAGLGVALHYLIALAMSLVYYLAAQRCQVLWRRAPIALLTQRATARSRETPSISFP